MVEIPFRDRAAAGETLARVLLDHTGGTLVDPVVVALPRGGVPVAAAVARVLGAELDVAVVRKLGVPARPELAMGALGEGGVRVVDREVVRDWHVSDEQLALAEARGRVELSRRAHLLRAGRPRSKLRDRAVIVVDDGLATGSTARAAIGVVRAAGARSVDLAVPVAPPETAAELARIADAVVCVARPSPFGAVGQWYRDFTPTTDDEVVRILEQFRA